MAAEGKVKTSYELLPEIKHKLTGLKNDLRLRLPGVTGISEAAIIEALIGSARLSDLEKLFRSRG